MLGRNGLPRGFLDFFRRREIRKALREIDGIVLEGAFAAQVNASMAVGAVEETVVVTGASPVVDVQTTARRQVVDREFLETLPNTGNVAAVQQVTEADEELLLISAGGQVVRTEVKTINRQHAQARGVITMRLNEGDKVVGIAAFRAGLADRDGMGDDDTPGATGPGQTAPTGGQ